MPIYEYQCKNCQRVSEIIQKVDDPPPVCGDCEAQGLSGEMYKLLSRGGIFILNGSCWAKDGYSKGNKK